MWKVKRWKLCWLRFQRPSEVSGKLSGLSSLMLTWRWGQAWQSGQFNSQALEESNHLCFISRCTNIQGWHSLKPENSLKWKLEREKKEKESRDNWGWGRALIATCLDAAHNLKQALRFITVPRSDPWHIRAKPLKNKTKPNQKKRCASLKPLFCSVIFLYPFGGCVAGAFASSKGFLPPSWLGDYWFGRRG